MRLREVPEVRFLKSDAGVAVAAAVGVAIVGGLVAWVRRGDRHERRERQAMLAAATGTAAVSVGFVEAARRQGWFGGAYLEAPRVVRLVFEWPVTVGYYTLWLAGYRSLTAGARHPYWIAGVISAGMAPGAIAGGQWELARGYYRLGHGWRLGYNAILTPLLLGMPVLLYEGLRERLPSPAAPAAAPARSRIPALRP